MSPAVWSVLSTPRYGGLAVLVAVLALLPIVLVNRFYYDVAINIGIAAMVAIGLNLLMGFAGQISLGHAGFFGLGAYCSAILTSRFDWPPLLALVAGLAVVGTLAFVLARPILRLKGHYLAMGTLGLGVIVSIILNQEVGLTGGPDGMPVPPLSVAGWAIESERTWYWVVSALLVLCCWIASNLIESPAGRALRSIDGSEPAAAMIGVNISRYKTFVFVVSALFASLAGSLFAHHAAFLTPVEAGFFKSVEFVTMVVLGGVASIYGSVLGAAVLVALPQFLTFFHEYEHLVFGLVLILTMIFLPKGVVPSLYARFRRGVA